MGTVAVVHALDTADELAVVRHRGGGGGTEEEEEVWSVHQEVDASSHSQNAPEKVLHLIFGEPAGSTGAVQKVCHDIFARAVLAHDVGPDTAGVVLAHSDDAHDVHLI